jgi:hypothetical protein
MAVKLTKNVHLLPSRIRGSIHSFPNTPSWRSAQLVKHKDKCIIIVINNDSRALLLGLGRFSSLLSPENSMDGGSDSCNAGTGQHEQNKRIHIHLCLQRDSNSRLQLSSLRREFLS